MDAQSTGSRLTSITPCFIVRDVMPAISFYRDQLGFEMTFLAPDGDPFFAILKRDGVRIMIKAIVPDVQATPNPTRHPWARWDAFIHVADPDALADEFTSRGVVLHEYHINRGKNAALHDTVPRATGDVVVFTDANGMYRPDALRRLVAYFEDARVGSVCGELIYLNYNQSAVAEGYRSAELFDERTSTWTEIATLAGPPREHHTSAATGSGKVIVFGGKNPNVTPLNSTEILDVEPGKWRFGPLFGEARTGPGVLKLESGNLLVAGVFALIEGVPLSVSTYTAPSGPTRLESHSARSSWGWLTTCGSTTAR